MARVPTEVWPKFVDAGKEIKAQTIEKRRLLHRQTAA
jgi:hypothetical protein